MERGLCVRSTSRSSPKAGDAGHVLSGCLLTTRCGWGFDHSRAPDRRFGFFWKVEDVKVAEGG